MQDSLNVDQFTDETTGQLRSNILQMKITNNLQFANETMF